MLRITDVRVGPLSSVDESFAWDEGEETAREVFFRAAWHPSAWSSTPEMATVFERFEVLFAE